MTRRNPSRTSEVAAESPERFRVGGVPGGGRSGTASSGTSLGSPPDGVCGGDPVCHDCRMGRHHALADAHRPFCECKRCAAIESAYPVEDYSGGWEGPRAEPLPEPPEKYLYWLEHDAAEAGRREQAMRRRSEAGFRPKR